MAYDETTNAGGVGTTTQVVVGLFNNANDAHQAVTQLRANGFSSGQIGAAFRSQSKYSDTTRSATGSVKHDAENWWEKVKDAFRSDDKVETRKEALADPAVDAGAYGNAAPYVNADPYANTDPYARGEYEYDFVGDDFTGSLAETGIPSDRAAQLTRSLKEGGAIVTVRDVNRASEAEQILSSNHGKVRYEDIAATDVNGTNNWDKNLADTGAAAIDAADSTGRQITDTGYVGRRPADDRYDNVAAIDGAETNASNTDRVRADLPAIDAANSTGREITDTGYADRRPVDAANSGLDRVQLFGEVLRVHKERISRGEVRVRKDVVTENQSIEVPVTREELVLERVGVPGNTPAPSAKIGNPQEIRVPLSEDKVRLEKQPVVREEVLVGKREVEDVARVGDQVRHEELRVDSDTEAPSGRASGEDVSDDGRRRG